MLKCEINECEYTVSIAAGAGHEHLAMERHFWAHVIEEMRAMRSAAAQSTVISVRGLATEGYDLPQEPAGEKTEATPPPTSERVRNGPALPRPRPRVAE